MTDLNEMQFEILPNVDASSGFAFGIGREVSVDDGGFDPGSNSWSTQDGENPTRGTTQFGRDHLTGPTWAWSLHVNRDDVPNALDTLGRLATAWRGQEIVDTPGTVLPIRYRLGDRYRRVYGRPRNFAAPPSNRILGGFVPVTCDFKCVDAYTYDDIESSVVVSANVSQGTGFKFPVVFPTTTTPATDRAGVATVLGDAPAYPVIRIDGPITNPYVVSDDWRLDIATSLGVNDWLEIDARPWELTVLKNGTQSLAGQLGRRQWLSDVKLKPGQVNFTFGGSASSGSATCAVSWRNTFNSL